MLRVVLSASASIVLQFLVASWGVHADTRGAICYTTRAPWKGYLIEQLKWQCTGTTILVTYFHHFTVTPNSLGPEQRYIRFERDHRKPRHAQLRCVTSTACGREQSVSTYVTFVHMSHQFLRSAMQRFATGMRFANINPPHTQFPN